jgi:hypothetical protein
MKKLRFFSWLLMATLAASLPITAQAAGGHIMGGGPHFSGGRGRDFAFHDGSFHNRLFAHDRFFRRHHRFVSNFAFVGFDFPDWYPNYYNSYPDDYSNNYGEPGYDDLYFDQSSVPTLIGTRPTRQLHRFV